jgi:acyl-homoserine lactone acylase PvdQ
MDDNLLFYRKKDQPKKSKLNFTKGTGGTIDLLDELGGGLGGSNCWVISGKHTKSGKPILSADPHLIKWM